MVSELVIAGGTVAGLVLLSQQSGAHAGSTTITAMDYLRQQVPFGGLTWQVPPNNDPRDAYTAMKNALTALYGADGQGRAGQPGMLYGQLYEIVNVWIGAYAAGCNSGSTGTQDYRLGEGVASRGFTCDSAYCGALDQTTPLGQAVCDASSWRSHLASSAGNTYDFNANGASASDVQTTLSKCSAIANEMAGADVLADGSRYSDKTLGDAASDIVSGAGSLVGKALGGVAGAVVGSSLFWIVGLGLVGYVVLRRAG